MNMNNVFKNSVVAITGATGSWGTELIKQLLEKDPKQIIDRLDLVIHGNFKKALEAFARNRTD